MAETLVTVPINGKLSSMRVWGKQNRNYPSKEVRNRALQLVEKLQKYNDKVANPDIDLRFTEEFNSAIILALDKLKEIQEEEKNKIKINQEKKMKQILIYQEELVELRKKYLGGIAAIPEDIQARMDELKANIADLSLRINILQIFYDNIQYFDKFEFTDGFREYDTLLYGATESLHNYGLAFDFNHKVYDYIEREIVYRVFGKYGIVCPLFAINGIDNGCHMEYSRGVTYTGELLNDVDLDLLVQTYIDYFEL